MENVEIWVYTMNYSLEISKSYMTIKNYNTF